MGLVNMPSPLVRIEQVTPQSGSPTHSGLLRQRSYSPSSRRFSPYGVPQSASAASPGAPTKESGVVRGLRQPYMPTLAEYQARLCEQVLATIVPLFALVAQTSQPVQQIGTIAGQVLQTTQQVQVGTEQLKGEVIEVLRAYMQQTKTSTQQQLSSIAKVLMNKIAQASSIVEETV